MRIRTAAIILLTLIFASCGTSQKFAGSNAGSEVSRNSAKKTLPQTSTTSRSVPQSRQSSEDQVSAPTEELDVSNEGFDCSEDLAQANGLWSGHWSGKGPKGSISGTVELAMAAESYDSLTVTDYQLLGVYAGDQIESAILSFSLGCGSTTFEPVKVKIKGSTFTAILKMEKQTWNPASLSGTWVVKDNFLGIIPVAEGTWSMGTK
jgi:hypothetical protein